jgi:hypothetical protein
MENTNMNAKEISNILFNFNPATKAIEVVDFLAKQGIEATEHSVRAYKAWVTMANS